MSRPLDGPSEPPSVAARVRVVLLLAFVLAGAVVLSADFDGPLLLAVWLPLAGIAVLHLPLWGNWARSLGAGLGAVVIPVFALLGVDWAWPSRLDPLPSLVVGGLVVGAAAWVWLGPGWFRPPAGARRLWTALVVLGLVVLPPVVFGLVGLVRGDERALDQPPQAVSKLDVVVLRDGTDAVDAKPVRLQGWDVRSWVGQVDGDQVRWGPEGPPPPGPEEDADRILLLMVDGDPGRLDRADALPTARPERGEVRRWLRIADQVTSPSTPTFALLRTTDDSRVRSWGDALAGRPGNPAVRRGRALSLEEVEGPRTIAELALLLAVRSQTSDQDLALAARHRPALFFDSGEPHPTPLNVDRVLESGRMRLCDRGQALRTLCTEVRGSADLHNGAAHFAFDRDEIADITQDSTIYVNVTRSGNDYGNTVYLDYWWYFPDNPTGAAGGALCGAGFVIAGVTCFDHQSDWEGVTVILDEDSPSRAPAAVSYAQHDGVIRYTWSALERLWDDGDRDRFGKRVDTGLRPLVFVARGTHASYPVSCSKSRCRVGGVPGIAATRPLKEASHDGGKPWPADEAADCPAGCLTALPTRNEGREPARWNAFSRRWGTTNCVLGVACASSKPPRSPGLQGRFARPWCAKRAWSFADERFRPINTACTGRTPSESEIAAGEKLLSLGDSFSSGEGAGSYNPDTNRDGNTCHRSRLAWPQRLARTLDLVALPSLACSGAVMRDVIEGAKRGEKERRVSQVSRIARDPDVITITIGGNDAGFANVLRDCVTGDCVRKYKKPSGDVLEGRIKELASQLPRAYGKIRDAAPQARLVVMGYPRLFPEKDLGRAGNCAAFNRIRGDETAYLNELVRKMNTAIAGAAEAAGAEFVDVTEAFDGQELRCSGPSYMNRLRILPRRLFKASFHPNARGYARLAEVVASKLTGP